MDFGVASFACHVIFRVIVTANSTDSQSISCAIADVLSHDFLSHCNGLNIGFPRCTKLYLVVARACSFLSEHDSRGLHDYEGVSDSRSPVV